MSLYGRRPKPETQDRGMPFMQRVLFVIVIWAVAGGGYLVFIK